ncbi:MAG: hypothetical protein LH632_01160, partial [Rhodoferax sp.]|nr:hypothetical protein [Rhodoferax sp.]
RSGGATLMLSFVTNFRGDLPQTGMLAAELMRAGEDSADPQLTSWGYQIRGYAELALGPLDEAVAHLREGTALAARIPAWDNFLYQVSLLAKCLVLQGKFDAAVTLLGKTTHVIEVEKFHLPFDVVEVMTAFATCSLAVAEHQAASPHSEAMREARRACETAVTCARVIPGWLPEALRLRGNLDWLCGKPHAALRWWRESLVVAEKSAFPIERARTLLEMGHRTGDVAQVAQASEIFRQTGARVFLAHALHCQAQLHERSSPDALSAMPYYARAITALEEVNANHALERARSQHARLQGKS